MKGRKPDDIRAHLDKSVISNILAGARASLKEPSRPFTPAETTRSLFAQNDYANRPSSSYGTQVVEEQEKRRPAPISFDAPIQTNRKGLASLEVISREPVKPKAAPKETNALIDELRRLQAFEEVRGLYTVEDLDSLPMKLQSSDLPPELLLRELALTMESFTNEPVKLLKLAAVLLSELTRLELLIKQKRDVVETHNLAMACVKAIYKFSKLPQWDKAFTEQGVYAALHDAIVAILNSEFVELDGQLPFDWLIYALGTIKNISLDATQVNESVSLMAVLSKLLPLPSQFAIEDEDYR